MRSLGGLDVIERDRPVIVLDHHTRTRRLLMRLE